MFDVVFPPAVQDCALFLFDNQKDLAMTFCRVQEYYESDKEELKDNAVTFEEFIDIMMAKDGTFDYCNVWAGFNFPGEVYKKWKSELHLSGDRFTYREGLLDEALYNNDILDKKRFYVIGALKKDKVTINHELSHALYTLNSDYANEMNGLVADFIDNCSSEHKKTVKFLKESLYADDVIIDEIQAYLSTSTKSELVDDFQLNYTKIYPFIKKFRKVLRKYNNLA
jgi:hypothetical protein